MTSKMTQRAAAEEIARMVVSNIGKAVIMVENMDARELAWHKESFGEDWVPQAAIHLRGQVSEATGSTHSDSLTKAIDAAERTSRGWARFSAIVRSEIAHLAAIFRDSDSGSDLAKGAREIFHREGALGS